MEYKILGRTGMRVSQICLGTGPFGVAPTEQDAFPLVGRALDLGINFFDTANSYGNFLRIDRPGAPPFSERNSAEVILGKTLKGHRDDVIIATKVREVVGEGVNDYGLSRRHIMQQIEQSLRALQTDYIDLYQLHGPDYETPLEETLKTLDDLVHQGKIRYAGLSNFSAWRMTLALGICERLGLNAPVSHQMSYNLVNRRLEGDVIPACQYFGVSVTTFGSLNGGLLSGTDILKRPIYGVGRFVEDKSVTINYPDDQIEAAQKLEVLAKAWGHPPAHLALAWLFAQPTHASAIIGPETVGELEASAPAADLHLDSEQLAALDELNPPPIGWDAAYAAAMGQSEAFRYAR